MFLWDRSVFMEAALHRCVCTSAWNLIFPEELLSLKVCGLMGEGRI